MAHPYEAREGTELWKILDRCVRELEQNSDIELRTDRGYVVGYLCQQLSERLPVAEGRRTAQAMSSGAVWVFKAPRATFPGAVFSSLDRARTWIAHHRLTGILTAYPVDQGVYDWATSQGLYPADKPANAAFIGSFTSAHQEHYHFEEDAEAGAG